MPHRHQPPKLVPAFAIKGKPEQARTNPTYGRAKRSPIYDDDPNLRTPIYDDDPNLRTPIYDDDPNLRTSEAKSR